MKGQMMLFTDGLLAQLLDFVKVHAYLDTLVDKAYGLSPTGAGNASFSLGIATTKLFDLLPDAVKHLLNK